MIILFIVIIIIIIVIELYSYLKSNFFNIKNNSPVKKSELIDIKNIEFNKFKLNDSEIIDMEPSYIYTKDNENLFIMYDNEFILMKCEKIYNIKKPFKLEFIYIKNPVIYYTSKNKI